jgi:hypothetical protein
MPEASKLKEHVGTVELENLGWVSSYSHRELPPPGLVEMLALHPLL